MPQKCCVPGCRGNYSKSDKVSAFHFPSDIERRRLWISKIPRADFEPSSYSVVCAVHFIDKFIVQVDSVTRPDGSVLKVERSKPKLTVDAYPSIFPNCPTYLSTRPPVRRKRPEDRRTELEQRDDQAFAEWLETDKIKDFEDFCSSFETRVDNKIWLCTFHGRSEPFVSLYRICDLPASKPILASTIRVFNDLRVEIFTEKNGEYKSLYIIYVHL